MSLPFGAVDGVRLAGFDHLGDMLRLGVKGSPPARNVTT